MPTGLTNHQIAQLSSAITKDLREKLMMALPQCLRVIVSEAIVDYLEKNNLKINEK